MKCSNCTSDALYALAPERVSPVYYCSSHLPAFLRVAASKGQLDLSIPPAPAPTTNKKKSAPVEEPAPEEEPAAPESEPEVEDSESDEE